MCLRRPPGRCSVCRRERFCPPRSSGLHVGCASHDLASHLPTARRYDPNYGKPQKEYPALYTLWLPDRSSNVDRYRYLPSTLIIACIFVMLGSKATKYAYVSISLLNLCTCQNPSMKSLSKPLNPRPTRRAKPQYIRILGKDAYGRHPLSFCGSIAKLPTSSATFGDPVVSTVLP